MAQSFWIVETSEYTFTADFVGVKSLVGDEVAPVFIESSPVILGDNVWCVQLNPNKKGVDDNDLYFGCYLKILNATSNVSLEFSMFHVLNNGNVIEKLKPNKVQLGLEKLSWGLHKFVSQRDTNELRVKINLTIFKNVKKDSVPVLTMAKQTRTMEIDVKEILNSFQFHDLKFIVGDTFIPVHRFIVMARSDVFKAMFTNNMAESVRNEVEIVEFSHDTVQQLVHFMYFDKCESLQLMEESAEWRMDEALHELVRIADKYQVHGLMEAFAHKAFQRLDSHNFLDLFGVAQRYEGSSAMAALKVVLLNYAKMHGRDLMKKPEFVERLARCDGGAVDTTDLLHALWTT